MVKTYQQDREDNNKNTWVVGVLEVAKMTIVAGSAARYRSSGCRGDAKCKRLIVC